MIRPTKGVLTDEFGDSISIDVLDMQYRMEMNNESVIKIVGKPRIDVPSICSTSGHHYDKVAVVYRDGLAVVRCVECEARATLPPELGIRLKVMQLNALCIDATNNDAREFSDVLEQAYVDLEELTSAINLAQAKLSALRKRAT